MQKLYASTFITGFQEVVQNEMSNSLDKLEIRYLGDGIVLYSTETAIKTIQKLPYFNNTYVVFRYYEDFDTTIDDMMKDILDTYRFYNEMPLTISRNKASFRIIASYANKMVGMKPTLKSKLEHKISHQLKIRLDKVRPKTEFWFISRKEGLHFFGLKITQHPDYTKSLPPGALRPELAYLLCSAAGMHKHDVFLDPFAGYGALPLARKLQPYSHIVASDSNGKTIGGLKRRLRGKSVTVQQDDGLQLRHVKDSSVTVIVTDPPWGLASAQKIDFVWFYGKMLEAFHRVLQDEGRCVVITGSPKAFEKAVSSSGFTIETIYTTLVSGKKAVVFVLDKA